MEVEPEVAGWQRRCFSPQRCGDAEERRESYRDLLSFAGASLSVFGFLILSIFQSSCVSHEFPDNLDCTKTDLAVELVATSNPVRCDRADGTIEVSATGGKPPYQFSLGSGPFGGQSFFSDLGAGSFTVTVKDSRGCEKLLISIRLAAPNSTIAEVSAIDQTNCLDPDGSITVIATGGILPYLYKLNDGSFGNSSTFSALQAGLYTITIMDAAACSTEISQIIQHNTAVSYETDIEPILHVNCIKSGCHNGDNGSDRNWRIFANVQNKAQSIKARTADKTMPPGDLGQLTKNEIDLIACWVDDGAPDN